MDIDKIIYFVGNYFSLITSLIGMLENNKYSNEKYNDEAFFNIAEEFEALETPEARFVKDLDRIEAVLQARYYDMTQRSPEKLVPEFSAYAEKNLCSGEKAIAEILKKLDG